jgi:hypothetical protein
MGVAPVMEELFESEFEFSEACCALADFLDELGRPEETLDLWDSFAAGECWVGPGEEFVDLGVKKEFL